MIRRILIFAVLVAASVDAAAQSRARPARRADLYDPLQWLRSHASALQGVSPSLDDNDLATLDPHVAAAGIVSLGDASHGTREFYQLKHRLIRYLITHHGFTVVAFEGPWPEYNRINDWVHGGSGDPAELLHDEQYWFWKTQETVDFLWWLRNYNANRGDRPPVRVAGIDPYFADSLIDDVVSYLGEVDRNAATAAQQAYGCLSSQKTGAVSTTAEHLCIQNADSVIRRLEESRETYVAKSSGERFDRVLQSARMVRQSAEIWVGLIVSRQENRDLKMGENLSWLHESGGDPQRRKVVFWGHNLHVSRTTYILSDGGRKNRSAGSVLAERYGSGYYAIGTATLRGRWLGITSQQEQTFATAEIPELPVNSYERLFAASSDDIFFVPFRGTNPPPSITAPRPMLIMLASPIARIFTLSITEMYDAVIFIEQTTEFTLLR